MRQTGEAEKEDRGRVKTGAEVGLMWPQAQDGLAPPKLEEAGGTLPESLEGGRGPTDGWISDFWPPEPQGRNLLLF